MTQDTLTGTFVAEDTRTEDEKAQDYTSDEILGGSVVLPVWQEKEKFDWDIWSLRDQINSSSCGGQAGAKAIEGFYHVVASATPIYRHRANFAGEGMWQQNIGDILKKIGTTSEARMTSQKITEEKLNSFTLADIADTLRDEKYTISAYYFLGSGKNANMDAIAQALALGHAVIFLVRTNGNEWQEVVTYKGGDITFSHFVTAVGKHNFTLYNGEKSVVIDDSCNAFSTLKKDGQPTGQRILTEMFIRERVAGVMAIVPSLVEAKPKHTFTKYLTYGLRVDKDVVALQDILKHVGYMSRDIPSTGNFLQLTAKAVVAWQVANGMDDFANAPLSSVRVGPKSVALLNKLYS